MSRLAVATLLAAASLAPYVAAQAPSPVADTTTDAEAQEELQDERRRILQLADGGWLRGKTRRVTHAWEHRADGKGGAWRTVDGEVVGWRLERDVESEARRRSADIARRDSTARVALAEWMLDQGLEREALRELDRVLARVPEHPAVLRLVRERPIGLELDGADHNADHGDPASVLYATVRAGAGADLRTRAGVREVAVWRLADFHGQVDLTQLVKAELRAPQPTRRAFATLTARRLMPGELMRDLARRALLDPMPNVREGAALALRDAHDPQALSAPLLALESENANLRANAIEALGVIGHPGAVAPLIAHLANLQAGGGPTTGVRGFLSVGLQTAIVMDYDVEIAQGASIGDPTVSILDSGVMHDVRAQAQITRTMEIRTTIGTLERLAHRDLGRSADAWQAWWDENAAGWQEHSETARATHEAPTTPR